jgi:hypothetical protein
MPNAKPNEKLRRQTLDEIVSYTARLIAEKKTLRALLERKRVVGWRDDYAHELEQNWQNQGPEFDVLHAHLKAGHLRELFDTLATILGNSVDPDS